MILSSSAKVLFNAGLMIKIALMVCSQFMVSSKCATLCKMKSLHVYNCPQFYSVCFTFSLNFNIQRLLHVLLFLDATILNLVAPEPKSISIKVYDWLIKQHVHLANQ